MGQVRKVGRRRILAVLVPLLVAALCAPARAQDAAGKPPLSAEQLEALAAPIALYPDALLAQVLMASTYPLEVVEAARWAKANPKVTGKALEDAMQQQRWDASVKSLTAFPQTLQMMNDKLDWTSQLGDAFLAQQNDLMHAVQVLRGKAQSAGNLESNDKQKVIVEPASGGGSQTIVIQPASPEVVYVPTYNPTVVYGAWPYPASPPYSYYPPGYAATSILSFGAGMAVGAALWGNCSWGNNGGNVNVNVNNYNNFNKTDIKNGNWSHNAEHRRGVQYRDQANRERYGKGGARDAQSREAFRGRADQGRQQIAKGGVSEPRGGGARGGGGAGARAGGMSSGAGAGGRGAGQAADRGGSRGGGAFSGAGNANAARQDSARGRSSQANAASWGGGGGRGGGGGGGGGGNRGGGGGGGGARGGGGGGRGGGGGGGGRGGGGRR